jgi:hypothetical protein
VLVDLALGRGGGGVAMLLEVGLASEFNIPFHKVDTRYYDKIILIGAIVGPGLLGPGQ